MTYSNDEIKTLGKDFFFIVDAKRSEFNYFQRQQITYAASCFFLGVMGDDNEIDDDGGWTHDGSRNEGNSSSLDRIKKG